MLEFRTPPTLDANDNRAVIIEAETIEGAAVVACLAHYYASPGIRAAVRDTRSIDVYNRVTEPGSPHCHACGPDPLAAERAEWQHWYDLAEMTAYGLPGGGLARHWSRTEEHYDDDFRVAYAVFPRAMDDDEIRRRLAAAGWPLERTGCRCDLDGRDCCGQWFSDGAQIDRTTVHTEPTTERPSAYVLRPRRGHTVAYVTWSRCL